VRHPLRLAVLLFAAALALGLLAAHTGLITPRDLRLDRDLQTATRTRWLNRTTLDLSQVASPVGGLVILAVWCGWLLARRRPVAAVSTFLVVAVGWNVTEVAKLIVARHRPPAVFSLAPETGSNSFPSGHTSFVLSAALAAYFLARGTRRRRPVALAGAGAVVLIGFCRLYIGAHYPTDLLGSLLVSSAAITALTGLWPLWILPNLHRVPWLARFGPLPTPARPDRHDDPPTATAQQPAARAHL
jgi:membrane-associated phospholipid phosphatase